MKIAIITDIHEDIISLQVILRRIEKFKVDDIICLGDISGFSIPYYSYLDTRNAHECLNLIRSVCSTIVLGNHDLFAAQKIPENSAIFDFPDNWYDLDYLERKEQSKGLIWLHEENDLHTLYTKKDIEFLRTLPTNVVYKTDTLNILFSHYIHPNISGLKTTFYSYSDEFRHHFQYMKKKHCTLSFCGHIHSSGYFLATPGKITLRRYGRSKIRSSETCIGLPPVALNNKKSGFCIFDNEAMQIKVIKI